MDHSRNACHTVANVSVPVLFSRKEDAMARRALRIVSIIIIIQSLLFFPAPDAYHVLAGDCAGERKT
jgi:hypothetical protein